MLAFQYLKILIFIIFSFGLAFLLLIASLSFFNSGLLDKFISLILKLFSQNLPLPGLQQHVVQLPSF